MALFFCLLATPVFAVTPPTISINAPSTARGIIDVSVNYTCPDDIGRLTVIIESPGLPRTAPLNDVFISSGTSGTFNLKVDTNGWPEDVPTTITAWIYYNNLGGGNVTDIKNVVPHNTPYITIASPSGKVKGMVNASLSYDFPSTYYNPATIYLERKTILGTYSIIASQTITLSSVQATIGTWNFSFDVSSWVDNTYELRARASYLKTGYDYKTITVANNEPEIPLSSQVDRDKATFEGEPINVATGNMYTDSTDISIPAKEIPLELSRTYNSQDDFDGSFGYGWRSNFDIVLREGLSNSIIEVDEKGAYTIYAKNPDETYTPSAGKYSQLTKNPDNSFTIVRKHGRKLYFDAQGKLIKMEERNGNALNILRTADGILQEISDSSGRKLLFTSVSGKITQVTDPAGRIFKYAYDAQGNLVTVIDPLRKNTTFIYDANHNLTHKTDPNGHNLYFEYDTDDRAYHSWQDNNNNAVTLSFDAANKTTAATDSLGNITKYEYNDYGLVTKITDALNNIQLFSWDENLNKTSSTDQNSFTTDFTYDNKGNLIAIRDPLNSITTFTYEPAFDFITSKIDALNNRTEYSYDLKGNLLQITDALSNVTTNTYDSSGQLIQAKDANNNTTDFSYDVYGNLIKITDAQNKQKSFTYNAFGKVLQETNALGNATSFAYDLLGRLIQTTFADGSKTTSTYDAIGNVLSFTDQARNTTKYTYDVVDRLISKTDALGGKLINTYDTEGNLISVTDPKSNKTQYSYDSLDRLIKTIDPLGNQTLVSYDPNSNPISKTDAKNNTTTYQYDSNNRLIQAIYADGSSVYYTYDALGRKTSMADLSGTTFYAYDTLNRLTQVDGPETNDTVSYVYDNVSNRIQMTNPDGGITNYTYDALNRVSTLTDPRGQVTSYVYDAVGNLINFSYPNTTLAVYTFDKLNRLTSLVNKKGPAIISSYSYVYNVSGMRTRVTFINGDYVLYTYDKLNRLLSEYRYNQSRKVIYSITYTYDALGNRLTENIAINNISFKISDYPLKSKLTYAYNAANQLTNLKIYEVVGKKLTLKKDTNYSYDANGNLIQQNDSQSITNYVYDFENRLKSVASPTLNESYAYNAEGKRISQIEGGVVTKFLYDGMNTILERDTSNQTIASYIRGLNYAGGIGGIISSYNASGVSSHYLYDGLGSVTGLTDSTGSTIKTYTYDAFGNILQQSGTATNAYQFQTKQTSPSSGLVYFGARYYNPLIGRFVTKDPSGMIDGPNMYVYLNNNPVNLIDPWGLCKEQNWWNDKQFWEEFERRRLPGHELFGIPTDLIGVGTTGGIYVGTKVATDQAARAATSSFQSTNLGKYGVYVSGYRPGWFTVSKVISKGSLLVTVFYASSDLTAFVTTLYDYTLKK